MVDNGIPEHVLILALNTYFIQHLKKVSLKEQLSILRTELKLLMITILARILSNLI
jgi:hypothetical protein